MRPPPRSGTRSLLLRTKAPAPALVPVEVVVVAVVALLATMRVSRIALYTALDDGA